MSQLTRLASHPYVVCLLVHSLLGMIRRWWSSRAVQTRCTQRAGAGAGPADGVPGHAGAPAAGGRARAWAPRAFSGLPAHARARSRCGGYHCCCSRQQQRQGLAGGESFGVGARSGAPLSIAAWRCTARAGPSLFCLLMLHAHAMMATFAFHTACHLSMHAVLKRIHVSGAGADAAGCSELGCRPAAPGWPCGPGPATCDIQPQCQVCISGRGAPSLISLSFEPTI